MPDLTPWPRRGPDVVFDPAMKPRLVLLVHTEEEFDWDAPFDRAANTVRHAQALVPFQERANALGYRPHYSCGYPFTRDDEAAATLKSFFDAGQASLGAHLHPWVCPPFEEEVSAHNSYPGNLPAAIERTKIETLTDALEARFGQRPRAYLAGRYGYGPHTTATLERLGYRVDFSPAPGWDYRAHGGPNWRDYSAQAFFNADAPGLLHIPHSGGHIGFACRGGLRRLDVDRSNIFRALKVPSIAARLGAVRQARLSLEGMEIGTMKTLVRSLFNAGARLFTLSVHSPSLDVGYTPYARTAARRDALFDRMSTFLDFFSSDMGGQSAGPEEMYHLATQARIGARDVA